MAFIVTQKEKRFFDTFVERGHDKTALINFIKGARNAPMYGAIFHIPNLCPKLKKELSLIYHWRLKFEIDGEQVREYISIVWNF